MLTKEQHSWIFDFLGIDVGAVAGAVKTTVQFIPGSAMLADCKPVKGKVPGPAEHLLCATHGHVLDIKQKTIIAVSLEQYKSQHLGSAKPAQAAPAAQQAPPPPATTAPPSQASPNGEAPSVAEDAAKRQAEAKQILNAMQSEVEDIASIRAQHEDLAGGGRLNRAVSWVSDKIGGADDPGDELAGIGGQIMMEQISGMAAAASLNLAAAHKHLATMQALNQKATLLWKNYCADTGEGAGRTVTGLKVVSKAGDVATMGLNVVAPGAGKVLSVAKNVSVTTSKIVFGEKVNWTEVTVDMAFDLFVGGEGGQVNKVADKLTGSVAKQLAPKLSEAIAKKWGQEAVAKKLGKEVTEKAIEEYIVRVAEEKIKGDLKDMVTPVVENVVESAKDTDITHEQLVDLMLKTITDPSGQFASRLSDKLMAEFRP